MRYIKLTITIIVICFYSTVKAQTQPVQQLDEVTIVDTKLKTYSAGVKIERLKDSVINTNAVSLTGLLAFNSNLYFKENGLGMISSPSFRGTNASQTAVIWNGININSQLTGQTDFNTINTSNYNTVAVRSGGGSVQYGSGAIGGSIHLNNNLRFNTHFENSVRLSYGSFNSKMTNFKSTYGNSKFSFDLGVAYVDSENDYKYLGTSKFNENGAYTNTSININLGYFISEKNIIKLYHQNYDGTRHFSGTLVSPSKSKYKNNDYRTMLQWSYISNRFSSKVKMAHLQERFKYFENKANTFYSFGKVDTWLLNHNLNIRLSEKLQFKTILEFDKFNTDGSSFGAPKRTSFSATALINHKPTKAIEYNVNLRKDFTSDFTNPYLFSVDAAYAISKTYAIQFNGSKNFRIPTFNDLYWQPGGNLNLKPELSYQIDFGQRFRLKKINFKINTYYIKTTDLIQWKPNNSGLWQPINVANAQSYGAEFEGQLKLKMNQHHFNFSSHYSYTVSEDLELKKQFTYVPFHKGNLALAYSFKTFSAFYQHLFNDEVFIIGNTLDGFNVGNLGFGYRLSTKRKIKCDINFRINNLYNKNYQNIALRPMPNRNYQILTTLKF